MTWQTVLYFSSILLTCILTGFLAWYAWRQPHVTGARSYAYMVLAESLLALTEIGVMLVGTEPQALFWFSLRVPFAAIIPVFWLFFAMEYSGRGDWLSKLLRVALFAIPIITQVAMVTGSLHGLWLVQNVAFEKIGPFWIADTSARIPGLWYLVHTFYSTLLLVVGAGALVVAAWRKPKRLLGQVLLVSLGALTALGLALTGVFNLLPELRFNPFVPGIGFSAVCYALAIFRFQFLKRPPKPESGSRLTDLKPEEKGSLAVLVLIFILLASGFAAASYITYQNYEKQFRAQVESQLSAIAALKSDEMQDWHNERMADASLFYRNENFSERVQAYFENLQDAQTRIKLLTWMEKIAASPEYDRVFLLDSHGVERLSIPAAPEAVPSNLVEQAAVSLDSDQITFLDFHRHSDSDAVHLSILVPVFGTQNNQPLGVLVLRINPNVYLYPFIQRWPVPSQSAETLLIRRDGNNALYLNELKFQQDTALNLRLPLENEDVPAVKAVLGFEGIVEGVDYRGVPVISDIRAVPDSPWFLVSKMDTSEVYAPLRARLWQTILFFGMLMLVTGAGLMLVWRQQRMRFYRGQIEAAEALRESEEKLRKTLDFLPLGISVLNTDRKIVYQNPALSKILNLTQDGLANGDFSKRKYLRADGLTMPADEFASVRAIREQKAIYNVEMGVVKEDGGLIWTEVNAVPIPLSDWNVVIVTANITERKRTEETLRASEEKFRLAFDTSPDSLTITRLADGTFVSVNKGFEQTSGYTRQQVVGKTSTEINIWKDPADRRKVVEELQATGEVRNYEAPFLTLNGEIYGLLSAVTIELNGEPHILNITRDISEIKRTEQKLKENETNLSALIENTDGSIWAVDQQYGLTVGNREFHRNTSAVLGRRLEMGESVLLPNFPPEVNAEWQGLYDRALRGESFTFETQTHFRESPHYIEYHFSPIREDDGEIRGVTVYGRDITERKQAEGALKKSQQRFEALLKLAPFTGVIYQFIYDDAENIVDWEISDINELGAASIGLTVEAAIGKRAVALFGKEKMLSYFEIARQVVASGQPQTFETYFEPNNRYYLSSVFMVDSDHYANMSVDITERKQAEEALVDSEQRLQFVLQGSQLGYWDWNLETNEVKRNERWAEMLGYHLNDIEFTVKQWVDFIHPDDQAMAQQSIQDHIEGRIPLHKLEYRMRTKDGQYKWILDQAQVVKWDSNQRAIRMSGTHTDITERKRAEEALQTAAQRIQIILSSLYGGILVVDNNGQVEFANQAFCDLFDLDDVPQDLLGLHAPEVIQKIANVYADPPAALARIQEIVSSGQPLKDEEIAITGGRTYIRDFIPITINGKQYGRLWHHLDITERKRTEEKLRESEFRLRAFFRSCPLPITISRVKDGVYTNTNAAYEKLIGFHADEIIGHSAAELNVWVDIQLRAQMLRDIQTKGSVQNFEFQLKSRDGALHDMQIWAEWIELNGEPHAFAIAEDITERKRAEEERSRLWSILDKSLNEIYIFDAQTFQFQYVNHGAQRNLGYPLEKLYTDTPLDIKPELTEDSFRELVAPLLLKQKENVVFETVHRRADGSLYPVDVHLQLVEQGGQSQFLAVINDITERRRAEETLQKSEKKYRDLVESIQIGVVAHAPDTSILFSNSKASQLLGLTTDQMLGKTAIDPDWHFIREDGTQMPLEEYPVTRTLSTDTSLSNLILGISRPDRKDLTWVQCDTYQDRDLNGKLQQIIVTFADITERRQAREQLLHTLEELKLSNAELEQFAYVASHDLQEPLRAVAGMVQLLQKRYQGQLDERADEYIRLAVDGASRMQTLIKDLLDYSRVERRGNPIKAADANEALKYALRNLETTIAEQGAVVTSDSLPTLDADATQLSQVFQNLIGNAIKFHGAQQPQVHVGVEKLADAWRFSVRDNGIGIEPQYFERIFLVFQRLHTHSAYSGTGIGLSICKKIVERHGGRIWIESQFGQGSTFYFTIPHRS